MSVGEKVMGNVLARVACVGVLAAGMLGLAAVSANAQTSTRSLKGDVVAADPPVTVNDHVGRYQTEYTCNAVGLVGIRMGQWKVYECIYAGDGYGWHLFVRY
jgi:hypothetical protein